MRDVIELIDALEQGELLREADFHTIITQRCDAVTAVLREKADGIRKAVYGDAVFVRGLIEFTNYCKNDCYYCGLRRSNRCVERYRYCYNDLLGMLFWGALRNDCECSF